MLPYQRLKLLDIGMDALITHEAGELHMPVLEHVDFQPLADNRHRDHHAVWPVTINPVPEALLVQQTEDAVEFMAQGRFQP